MKNNKNPYNEGFYRAREADTKKSAEIVLKEVFKMINPSTVCDFGCGVGTWLKVSRSMGVEKVVGYEGAWVQNLPEGIVMPEVISKDLSESVKTEIKFDLVINFEVAEHIEPSCAEQFVDNLTNASDVVLFSAAIPGQGGVDHVNEQWPSYWIEKFHRRGFKLYDVLRPVLWDSENVKTWYKQNALLFVKGEPSSVDMDKLRECPTFGGRSFVHPALLSVRISQSRQEFVWSSVLETIKRKVRPFVRR